MSSSKGKPIDDVTETVNEFLNKIAVAQGAGEESVETTPEIIAHFNKRGLGINPLTGKPNRHFVYNGIKVYPNGERDQIEAEQDEPLGQRMHGKEEGTLEVKA